MSEVPKRLAFATVSGALAWLGERAGSASMRGGTPPASFATACIATAAHAEIARLRAALAVAGVDADKPEGGTHTE